MAGTNFYALKNGSTTTYAILTDNSGNIILSQGSTVPSAEAGFAIGGLFISTSGTIGFFINRGTAASCTFTWLVPGT